MAPSVLSARPAKVFFDINGGDGASTSNSLQPLGFPTPTKFYVQFTITPVHEFHFLLTRRRRCHRDAAVRRGVVLERDTGGRISAAVWRGFVVDALAGAAGLGAAQADEIAKVLAVRLVDLDKGRERVAVVVEVEVVTPLVVALDAVVDAASEPAVAREVEAREGCGFCEEPLARDLVVRQAQCSHYFHWDCFGVLVSKSSRSCPSCDHVLPV